jgi:hypothetical protein
MAIFSHARAIKAPADQALSFIKAMVVMGVLRIASLIFVAASTLPPKVSISNIKAFALGCSLILLSTKEERPNSIVPLIGIK